MEKYTAKVFCVIFLRNLENSSSAISALTGQWDGPESALKGAESKYEIKNWTYDGKNKIVFVEVN